jgi:penicillin amidase
VYDGQNMPFESRKEVIQVKGEADTIIHVKSSTHGPIVSSILDDLSEEKQVAMWWTYLKEPSKLQATMYGMGKSSGLEEVQSYVANIHAPGLNVMYGDAKGNIAWWAAAKLPVRPDHVNSKMVLDGSKSADEPVGYLDFSQNPHAVNPPWNYVSNANNQPDSINGALYPGYYLPDSRAKRIVELLEAKDKVDVAYYKAMLLDNQSVDAKTMAAEIYRVLSPLVEDTQMLDRLNAWEGTFGEDDAVPLLFNTLIYHIFQLGMADELEDSFTDFSSTHLFKRSMMPLCLNDSSIWWDNVQTTEIEDRTTIFKQAYSLSIRSLEDKHGDFSSWKWKNVHTMEHRHPLGQVALLRKIFNVGPFGIGGTNEVLDNQMFVLNGEGNYPVLAGPSTRRIIDFADLDHSLSILPTGQSGNIMSPHYKDQAEMFAEGKFRSQLINWEEIESETESVLYFVPE